GLDGLGEGLLMICLLAFWIISVAQLDQVLSLFIAIWLGSLMAGIYFTIHPARAFLGNASGMAFGATLALVGLLSGKIIALLVMGSLFLIDGGSSLIQILGKNILKRRIFPIAPLHHYFEILGWEEPKIVARAWLTGLILALFGMWLAFL
ncbi:MAG: Phospho-N-acetylmuramoyl-pentapeptide-transferase, partial [Parcubacteria group bacterium GW2011_GWC1_43_11]